VKARIHCEGGHKVQKPTHQQFQRATCNKGSWPKWDAVSVIGCVFKSLEPYSTLCGTDCWIARVVACTPCCSGSALFATCIYRGTDENVLIHQLIAVEEPCQTACLASESGIAELTSLLQRTITRTKINNSALIVTASLMCLWLQCS
jgi:hypothetical protein